MAGDYVHRQREVSQPLPLMVTQPQRYGTAANHGWWKAQHHAISHHDRADNAHLASYPVCDELHPMSIFSSARRAATRRALFFQKVLAKNEKAIDKMPLSAMMMPSGVISMIMLSKNLPSGSSGRFSFLSLDTVEDPWRFTRLRVGARWIYEV